MTTRQLLVSTWDWNPIVIGVCLVALLGYAKFTHRRLPARSGCFFAGIALCFLTLASPVNFLAAGYLFSAHMLQHLLLLLVVPPLLLLGLPEWKVKAPGPAEIGTEENSKGFPPSLPKFRIHPFAAWLAGLSAMWIWHERTL